MYTQIRIGLKYIFITERAPVADLENFEEHLLAACGRRSLIVIGDNSGSRSRSVVIHVVS